MQLPSLNGYVRAESPQQVVRILADNPGKAKILAGGTTIYELVERKLLSGIEIMVDIERAGLNYVTEKGDRVLLGSATTLGSLLESPAIRAPRFAALADALRGVKPVQVRNVATVGGALCSSISFFDFPIALCAVGATLRILGAEGGRSCDVGNFFLDMFTPDLKEDELLVEAILQKDAPELRRGSSFLKIGRTTHDYGMLSTATSITLNEKGECLDAKIFFGNVGTVPYRDIATEDRLRNRALSQSALEEAAATCLSGVEPIESVHASASYKKKVSRHLLAESLRLSLSRCLGGG